MMVMRRREGEKILIGDNIVIHINHIGRNRVRIGIEAPREMPIVAEEVRAIAAANLAAASTPPEAVKELVGLLQAVGFRQPVSEHERAVAGVRI